MTKLNKISLQNNVPWELENYPRLMSKMERIKRDCIEEAINLSCITDLFIEDSEPNTKWISLFVKSNCDCGSFWKIYTDLKSSKYQQVYEFLVNCE